MAAVAWRRSARAVARIACQVGPWAWAPSLAPPRGPLMERQMGATPCSAGKDPAEAPEAAARVNLGMRKRGAELVRVLLVGRTNGG